MSPPNRLDPSEHYLTREEEQLLLRIARDALDAWLHGRGPLALDAYSLTDAVREKHGAFVTLRNGPSLRGCIGHISNAAPLAAAVRDNAVNAATGDPRFEPVTAAELPALTIEVSALTPGDTPESPFRRVGALSEIVIGRDGLYIERAGSRGGLLLPQVATEQAWDVPAFLSAVCRKAGYPDRAWEQPDVTLYRFSAQVFSEGEDQSGARHARRGWDAGP
jgi:AmmeMemoRadiSam system protein A